MQGVPRSCHADVGEEQHRPGHNRTPVGHHKICAPHMLQMLGVRARPDGTDDQIWSADNHRCDDQFTYRHLEPQQPSQRVERLRYVNGGSRVHEHFLVIFLKWAALSSTRPLWCLPWRAPGPPAPLGVQHQPEGSQGTDRPRVGRGVQRARLPGVSMETIAKRVGISAAALYRHSRATAELFRDAVLNLGQQLVDCTTFVDEPRAIPSWPCVGSSRRSSTPRWPTASRGGSTAGKAATCRGDDQATLIAQMRMVHHRMQQPLMVIRPELTSRQRWTLATLVCAGGQPALARSLVRRRHGPDAVLRLRGRRAPLPPRQPRRAGALRRRQATRASSAGATTTSSSSTATSRAASAASSSTTSPSPASRPASR